jgi:hypothetical protein
MLVQLVTNSFNRLYYLHRMKGIVTCCLLLFSLAVCAQLQLKNDTSFVQDGALVMRFSLVNQSPWPITLVLDKRRSLQQLNAQHSGEALIAEVPHHFILFYNKQLLIDEEPLSCDHQVQQHETIKLQPAQSFVLVFQTHCLSPTVLTQLNRGRALRYEMVMRYEEAGTFKTIKTQRGKLKVKKPTF